MEFERNRAGTDITHVVDSSGRVSASLPLGSLSTVKASFTGKGDLTEEQITVMHDWVAYARKHNPNVRIVFGGGINPYAVGIKPSPEQGSLPL